MHLKSLKLKSDAAAGKLFLLATSISAIAILSQPVLANIVLPGRCHMGECWEQKFLGKKPLKSGPNGKLYSVKLTSRSWPMASQPSGRFGRVQTSYVYCSKTRPAYVFRNEGIYYAHLLNPGGDWYGYNRSDYPVYWATCHNLVGPDYFSEKMTIKARKLGYSLDLPSDQIELKNVLEIVD